MKFCNIYLLFFILKLSRTQHNPYGFSAYQYFQDLLYSFLRLFLLRVNQNHLDTFYYDKRELVKTFRCECFMFWILICSKPALPFQFLRQSFVHFLRAHLVCNAINHATRNTHENHKDKSRRWQQWRCCSPQQDHKQPKTVSDDRFVVGLMYSAAFPSQKSFHLPVFSRNRDENGVTPRKNDWRVLSSHCNQHHFASVSFLIRFFIDWNIVIGWIEQHWSTWKR